MCGICGIIDPAHETQAPEAVRRMLASLHHRGPDDEGLLVAPNAVLGMRRLSIIDVAGGAQPVWNENRSVAAINNGEIYNYKILRDELLRLGHHFATNSDTEVLVHGWEAWGADLPNHLRGMFAFAVAEMPEGPDGIVSSVFLARDRMGIKPLYYAQTPQGFVFSSEVRALLAPGLIAPALSVSALESYLLFGSVGEPETLLQGIHSLSPGYCIEIDLQNPSSEIRPRLWWNFVAHPFPESTGETRHSSRSEAEVLRAKLEDSVREHLISDVPLGIFLSSGIDSTVLTGLASREQSQIRTFTLAFAEKDFSEAEMARRIAAKFRTDHSEKLISPDEMLAGLDEAVAAMDQPTMDGINTWFVSEAARAAGLKVALSGLGSDELFGGYSTFRNAQRLSQLSEAGGWLPAAAKSSLAAALENLPGSSARRGKMRKALAAWAANGQLPHPYFFTRLLFTPDQTKALLISQNDSSHGADWREWLATVARAIAAASPFQQVSWLELRTYMLSTLLRDADAMSMNHSLEVRVPFLDHRLVEFALHTRQSTNNRPKSLLIEACRDFLPQEVIAQRKKTFTLPWEHWLRGPLRSRLDASFANPAPPLAAALDFGAIANVWQDFLRGRTGWARPWSLFVLNEWTRRHFAP